MPRCLVGHLRRRAARSLLCSAAAAAAPGAGGPLSFIAPIAAAALPAPPRRPAAVRALLRLRPRSPRLRLGGRREDGRRAWLPPLCARAVFSSCSCAVRSPCIGWLLLLLLLVCRHGARPCFRPRRRWPNDAV